MMDIELRKAQVSDHVAIATLHAESWKRTYRGIYSDSFLDGNVEEERMQVWKDRLENVANNQLVTVAIAEGKLAGFSCIFIDDDLNFGTLLDNLHVAQSLQGSGIGRLLLSQCAKDIIEQAMTPKMYLWVYEANTNSRKVYEHLGGFHYETESKKNADGQFADACKYIWKDVSILIKVYT